MKIWHDSRLCGIYNLTPLHCGTGQTSGAVDLPVARDAATGIPVLPPTSLKGVARDYAARNDDRDQAGLGDKEVTWLFGEDVARVAAQEAALGEEQGRSAQLEAGALVFTEGRLVAYPVRSLNRPFLHVTCRLVLERLARDVRALGIEGFFEDVWLQFPRPAEAEEAVVQVTDERLCGQPLALEDLVYDTREVAVRADLRELAQRLTEVLPPGETATAERLSQGLVMIPDEDFSDLLLRSVPVQARIKLTRNKTSENLWYEETLPSDCLFLTVVGERRQRRSATPESQSDSSGRRSGALQTLLNVRDRLNSIQIGGNETVGHGLSWWSFWQPQAGSEK